MSEGSTQRSRLLVVSHLGSNHTRRLPATGSFTIGRASSCDVQIDDSLTSRFHARLHLDEPIELEDLGSRNGVSIRYPASIAAATLTVPEQEIAVAPGTRALVPAGAIIYVGKASLSVHDIDDSEESSGVVVIDDKMRELHGLLSRAAVSEINLLLLGESGVGKEIFAQRAHRQSLRHRGPFVGLNCGAFSETLLESELFGHEKGAFTGAVRAKPGLFEAAAGGVVFLDEIGELSLTLQVKLLRVLQERQVTRLGALESRPIDIRLVSATNRHLETEVAEGRFREDLYYRVNGLAISIPPLRDRPVEIMPLAESFLHRACVTAQRYPVPEFSSAARTALVEHQWPGNIRELGNVVERALVLSTGVRIEPEHLALSGRVGVGRQAAERSPDSPDQVRSSASPSGARESASGGGRAQALRGEADEIERQRIVDALRECAGNQTHAARLLGMTRRMLISRIEKYGVPRPRKK